MACFLVSAVEAAVVTVVKKKAEKKEKLQETSGEVSKHAIPLSRKLSWLTSMLWGGVILLLLEHVWHGEVVPWFPFLTAMEDKSEAITMLKEMATVGVCMAVAITVIWFIMCRVAESVVRKKAEDVAKEQ